MQIAANALTPDELRILQASVREIGINGTARRFDLSRHAVAVLVSPDAPKRPGTLALGRARIAAFRARNTTPPRPAA